MGGGRISRFGVVKMQVTDFVFSADSTSMPNRTMIKMRFTFIAAILTIGLTLSGCGLIRTSTSADAGQKSGIDPSRKVTVHKGTIEQKVISPGKLIAQSSATAVYPISSQILAVAVKTGDLVKAGQPLLTLDATELNMAEQQAKAGYFEALATYSLTLRGPSPAAIASARSSLASALRSYEDLQIGPSAGESAGQKAILANAEAALRRAQSEYDRAKREDPGSISAAPESLALEQATNVYAAEKAAFERLFEKPKPSAIANSVAQIALARANLDALTRVVTETVLQAKSKVDFATLTWQQAEQNIKKAVVVAPIDGMVVGIAAQKGETVVAGARAVDIADFTSPIFEASVDEADVGGIRVKQDAEITIQAYPEQTYKAKVQDLAPTGSIASNVVTFRVLLSISENAGARPGEGIALLPGMSGKGEVIVASAEDVLVITTSLMMQDPDTDEFTVQRFRKDGTLEIVPVITGIASEDQTEITEGLEEGDVLLMPIAEDAASSGGEATPTPAFQLLPGDSGVGGAP